MSEVSKLLEPNNRALRVRMESVSKDCNREKVRQDLLTQEIIVEKLSGDVLDVEVSALKKIKRVKLKSFITKDFFYF